MVIDHHDALLARSSAAFPGVTVLPNAYAQGLSGARNTGIEASTGDVVCFLDDDAAAEGSWTTHLLAPYEDPNVLGVGGAAIPTWETTAPSWWPGEFGWVVGCSYRGQPHPPGSGPQPDGLQHVRPPYGPGRGRWLRHRARTPGRQPGGL